MKRSRKNRFLRVGTVAAVTLAVAGCGGGGGGGGAPPPASAAMLVIDAGNRDTVAHATAAGILAMSPVQTLPMATGAAAGRGAALGQVTSHRAGWLDRVIAALRGPGRAAALGAGAARVQPLEVYGPYDQSCLVSGSFTTTWNDLDNNADISAGDVVTVAFNACKDDAAETVDGVIETTVSEITDTVLGARMKMTNLSDATSRHSSLVSGSMQMYVEMVGGNVEITRLTASGPVVATVTTHVPFTDTVTLAKGFVAELTSDASAATSTLTVAGAFDSATAGGSVEVSTRSGAPIVSADNAVYPSAGVVDVLGKTGALALTVLSTDSVRLDLDANNDGVPESSQAVAWDWLF